MLACVAISTSFIISNSYILCLLISSDGLASLTCLSFFYFWGVKYCLLPVLISWAGMHHCTASASYFFQLREWSTEERGRSKCEGEKLDHFYLQAETSCFQAVLGKGGGNINLYPSLCLWCIQIFQSPIHCSLSPPPPLCSFFCD